MEFSFYNAAIAVTKRLKSLLTAVAWQLLPKSKIWTVAQQCRMQNYEYFLQKAEQMLCLLCYIEMVENHIQL